VEESLAIAAAIAGDVVQSVLNVLKIDTVVFHSVAVTSPHF
jgi:hypothetical protein